MFAPIGAANGVGYPRQLTLRFENPLTTSVRVTGAAGTVARVHSLTSTAR